MPRNPFDPMAPLALSVLSEQRGEHAAAHAWAWLAHFLDPDSAATEYRLGRLYAAENHYREAAVVLTHAGREHPDNPVVICTLGNAYLDAKQFPEAQKAFRKALALAPDEAESRLGLSPRAGGKSGLCRRHQRIQPPARPGSHLPGGLSSAGLSSAKTRFDRRRPRPGERRAPLRQLTAPPPPRRPAIYFRFLVAGMNRARLPGN